MLMPRGNPQNSGRKKPKRAFNFRLNLSLDPRRTFQETLLITLRPARCVGGDLTFTHFREGGNVNQSNLLIEWQRAMLHITFRRLSIRKMLSRAFKEHQTKQAAHREKQGIPASLIFSLVLRATIFDTVSFVYH